MNTRRQFLCRRALLLAPAFLPGGIAANDRIRVGIAGLKGRGFALLRSLLEMGPDHVEVAALCDVDSEVLSRRTAKCEKLNGGKRVTTVMDMRRMIEDKSIDAIIHATPTHWHALGAIWTMQAGKDAYIEKPLALTLWEGRKIVEAAAEIRPHRAARHRNAAAVRKSSKPWHCSVKERSERFMWHAAWATSTAPASVR